MWDASYRCHSVCGMAVSVKDAELPGEAELGISHLFTSKLPFLYLIMWETASASREWRLMGEPCRLIA